MRLVGVKQPKETKMSNLQKSRLLDSADKLELWGFQLQNDAIGLEELVELLQMEAERMRLAAKEQNT